MMEERDPFMGEQFRYANVASGSLRVANCAYVNSSPSYANVVPTADWTKEQLKEFAEHYVSYCYEIVAHGIVPASLFTDAGIELTVPKYVQEEREAQWRRANRWRWSNLIAHLKEWW
jgi:hypothetical protein